MPAPNVELLDSVLHAYRGIQTVAVGAQDVVFDAPVTVRAATTGNLIFEDALGRQHTLNGVAVGDDVVGPGGGLVLVRRILGASTVSSVLVGIA